MSASININKSLNWTFLGICGIILNGKWAKNTFQCFLQPPVRYQKTGIPEQNGWFCGATASFTDDSSLTLQKQQTNCVTSAIMPLEKAAFNSSVFWRWQTEECLGFQYRSVRQEEITRPPASCWPTRSSPPVWRPAAPCTDSWRSGKHHRGNTATRDGQVSVCGAVGRREDGEKEEYSHFHRQISACSSVVFSHYSPPTPQQDRRCYTNTPQVTI